MFNTKFFLVFLLCSTTVVSVVPHPFNNTLYPQLRGIKLGDISSPNCPKGTESCGRTCCPAYYKCCPSGFCCRPEQSCCPRGCKAVGF